MVEMIPIKKAYKYAKEAKQKAVYEYNTEERLMHIAEVVNALDDLQDIGVEKVPYSICDNYIELNAFRKAHLYDEVKEFLEEL